MKWQPMETAPITGELFLAYVEDEEYSFVISGYCMDDGAFIPVEGEGDYHPMHWMPMPERPEKS